MAGKSTILQLVAISTRIVSMYAEASRSLIVVPVAFYRILILLHYGLGSLAEIMNPSSSVELIDQDFVFYVLQQAMDTMYNIEMQVSRWKGS